VPPDDRGDFGEGVIVVILAALPTAAMIRAAVTMAPVSLPTVGLMAIQATTAAMEIQATMATRATSSAVSTPPPAPSAREAARDSALRHQSVAPSRTVATD